MGKILRLGRQYTLESFYITRGLLLFIKIYQVIKYFSASRSPKAAGSRLYTTTFTRSKPNTLSPDTLETLAVTALQACAAQPARFHDLSKLLTLEEKNRSLSFDIGENMARNGLAEFCFRASRICIKITPEGLNYLKAQESSHYKPKLA
ncbi:hypothetical protein FVR03_02440 [Pontibacter qinzhouensis]|uniref:Uncharacterized protein n=1 Tax=Pontibacter qinzhouensis TaxID=2603253 RepID=A0A5C8KCI6_9BACT|nr:hypothetical protein [Pontibacter qinzhouensis]TXK51962.1 hypothetical protein FVR03_02440 [Pontibacter qinzhouensis]